MSHAALGAPALRALLLLSLAACACAGWGRSPAPKFAVVPSTLRAVGQGQVEALAGEAANETFLDRLLGTNCFTRALKELDADCRSMGQEQKSRLALALVNCQQATHGERQRDGGGKQGRARWACFVLSRTGGPVRRRVGLAPLPPVSHRPHPPQPRPLRPPQAAPPTPAPAPAPSRTAWRPCPTGGGPCTSSS